MCESLTVSTFKLGLLARNLVCGIFKCYCQAFPFIWLPVSSACWEFVTDPISQACYIKVIWFILKREHVEDSELVSCSVGGIASRKKVCEIQMVAPGNTIMFGYIPKFQSLFLHLLVFIFLFPLVNEASICIMEWFRQVIGAWCTYSRINLLALSPDWT